MKRLLEIFLALPSSSLIRLGANTTNDWKETEMKGAVVTKMKHWWSKGGRRSSCVLEVTLVSSHRSSPTCRLKPGCILPRWPSLPRMWYYRGNDAYPNWSRPDLTFIDIKPRSRSLVPCCVPSMAQSLRLAQWTVCKAERKTP